MGRVSGKQREKLNSWSAWITATFVISVVATVVAIMMDDGFILVLAAGMFTISMLCWWGFIQTMQEIAKENDVPFYIVLREVQDDDGEN